uniref:Uncharacterized protein n=1 Tax=viral metagenome TaxID=1070528 RepID=A0A6C0I0P1_9ZZZZ
MNNGNSPFYFFLILIILIILAFIVAFKVNRCNNKHISGGGGKHISGGGSKHISGNNKHISGNNKQLLLNNSFNKPEGYVLYSKQIYHNIANHRINLNTLDLNKGKMKKIKQAKQSGKKYQHWSLFDSWEKLQNDSIAKKEYLNDRAEILSNPNLDWSKVVEEIGPKLEELREYIGIINIKKGTNQLYIKKYEGSPTSVSDEKSKTTFASIPSELVNKYANMVGLFMFHTHPLDLRGSPLPSSYDLSAALYFGSISRFAASVIISRYGILMYGLSLSGYRFLAKSKDYNLSILNLSFDIIAAHESIRSWSKWKLADYVDFYKRYKMFMYIFPSAEYVADNIKYDYEWNLTNPISHELIIDHYEDINNYLKNNTNYNNKNNIQYNTKYNKQG